MPSIVMTMVGPDRPGLVERVSEVVQRHGGNWLESRMAHLSGQFAGIVRIDIADGERPKLVAALKGLSSDGLTVVTAEQNGLDPVDSSPTTSIHVVGNDRPGIVKRLTSVLKALSVNVEELSTECSTAPHSGEPLFRAYARVRLPEGLPTDELQHQLEAIATDLMIDIELQKD